MRLLFAGLVAAGVLLGQGTDGAAIEGRVLNSLTSAPLRKAVVMLTSASAPIRLTANTDPQGRFQFTGLPAGTYRLSATHSGFLERFARRPVAVAENVHVTDAEIRLPPQGVLMGRVLDEDGEPVERATMWIFKQVYRYGGRQWERMDQGSTTNDAGEYRFSNLTPGRYLVQAYNTRPEPNNRYGATPPAFYVPAYYPNAVKQDQAVQIAVGVGAEVRDIDIHLPKLSRPPSARVRGRVTGVPANSPISVYVGLTSEEGSPFGAGDSMAKPPDYLFELQAPPGRYRIGANVYSGGLEAYGGGSLTVTGDVEGVVVSLSPAPELAGQVRVAEKGAKVNLQGVRLSLIRNGSVEEVRSDAAGKFAFSKPRQPGHYAIYDIRSIPDDCFVQAIKLDDNEISWEDFEILTSAPMEIILSKTAGQIAGSVLDEDSKPFPASTVTLIPTDGKSRPQWVPVDDDGNFRVTSLRPGKYQVFAWEDVDRDAWQDPAYRKSYESRATEVTVAPNETQNVQVRAIPSAR